MAWTGLADKREACVSGVSTFQNGVVFGVDDVRYFAEWCNCKRVGWEGCFALPIQGLYGKADELGKSGYGLYPLALTIGLSGSPSGSIPLSNRTFCPGAALPLTVR